MNDRERFFYDHAGYVWTDGESQEDAHKRSAILLAFAEEHAESRGWYHEFERDDADVMDDDVGSRELVESGEYMNGNVWLLAGPDCDPEGVSDVLGVLSGVVVPDENDPHIRVVAAELALVALANGGKVWS